MNMRDKRYRGAIRKRVQIALICLVVLAVMCFSYLYNNTKTSLTSVDSGSDDVGGETANASNASKIAQVTPISKTAPVGAYTTLWLQQVHHWFKSDKERITKYLLEAKEAGFKVIMTDLPWSWTERDREGMVDFDSHAKDWVSLVCDLEMELHIVVRMNELPPWLLTPENRAKGLAEMAGPSCLHPPEGGSYDSPSLGSDEAMSRATAFFEASIRHYVDKFPTCVTGFSPSFNNELETRYTQVNACMRDFNPSMVAKYSAWQRQTDFTEILAPADSPRTCVAETGVETLRWLEFRESILSDTYERLCASMHDIGESRGRALRCLLHFGESLATTDRLHSNALHRLASSPHVDDLIMDSNMALLGAPSSPSIVGVLVSTARRYNKHVHFEAATERILPCSDDGRVQQGEAADSAVKAAAAQLFKEGVREALEAGVDSIGFTNLCEPKLVGELLPRVGADTPSILQLRAEKMPPTAILFVPYRAFYTYNLVPSGLGRGKGGCGVKTLKCKDPSYELLPRFGLGGLPGIRKSDCVQDPMQYSVLHQWDLLRKTHRHVAVVMDVSMLDEALLANVTERVAMHFTPQMTERSWGGIYNGEEQRQEFRVLAKRFPFRIEEMYSLLEYWYEVMPEAL